MKGAKESTHAREPPIRLSANSLTETIQAKRENEWYIQTTKQPQNNTVTHSRIVYPTKLSFRCEGETKAFPDKSERTHHH